MPVTLSSSSLLGRSIKFITLTLKCLKKYQLILHLSGWPFTKVIIPTLAKSYCIIQPEPRATGPFTPAQAASPLPLWYLYLPFFKFVHFIFDLFLFFLLFLYLQKLKCPACRHLRSHHRPHRSAGPLWQVSGDSAFPPQLSGGKKVDSIRELSTRPMIGRRQVKSLPRWTCQGWQHPMLFILQRWLYSWIVNYSLTFFPYIRFQDFSDYLLMFDLF